MVDYLKRRPAVQRKLADELDAQNGAELPSVEVRLVHWDEQAEEKLVAALLYGASGMEYGQVWDRALSMPAEERGRVIDESLAGLGPHDAPPRELEVVDYTFEIMLDYGRSASFGATGCRRTCLSPSPWLTAPGRHPS